MHRSICRYLRHGAGSEARLIRITAFGKTDVGRKRELNEDSLGWSEEHGYCIVADGMGGRDFGEVASSICVQTLKIDFKKFFPGTLKGARLEDGPRISRVISHMLDRWIRDMNSEIWDFGSIDHRYREMGTTLAMIYHQADFVAVAHVGDSRVYRVRDGKIQRLTADHSFVNAQLKAGLITEEEAENSQHKNIITRAIGTRASVKADVTVVPAQAGDYFLLCSDGLSDLVRDNEILASLEEVGMDLEKGVQALIDFANERGGKDNITVLIARLSEASMTQPIEAS